MELAIKHTTKGATRDGG